MNNEEIMSKEELSELLHSLQIPVGEGKTSDKDTNEYPRALYWPFVEKDVIASGEGYKNLVTYQISLFARTPQHEKYKILRKKLREKGIHPTFQHEYLENDPVFSKTWHTYFAIDVLEDIENE